MQPLSPALAGRFFLSPTHLGRFPSLRHKAAYLEPSSLYQPLVLGCLLKIYLNAQEEGGESSMHCRHNRKLTECSFPVTPTLQLHITPQLRQCSCESELLPPILDPTGPRWYPTQPFSPVWVTGQVSSPEEMACSSPREGQQYLVPAPKFLKSLLQGGVLLSQCGQGPSALHWKLLLSKLTPQQNSLSRVWQKPSVRAPSCPKSYGGSDIPIVWNHLSIRTINTSRRQKRDLVWTLQFKLIEN